MEGTFKFVLCLSVVLAPCLAEDAPVLPIFPEGYNNLRQGRTLLGQFPFTTRGDSAHHGHHGHHAALRQDDGGDDGGDNAVDHGAVAAAAQDGERCVEKVMMVEEVVYDDEIECRHSYDQQCHVTYSTDYAPVQEEKCEEHFKKDCYIEYKTKAYDVEVEVCNDKFIKDCDIDAPVECETVHDTECETVNVPHDVEEDNPSCRIMYVTKCRDETKGYSTEQVCDKWPKQVCEIVNREFTRYSRETECKVVNREICGPGACPLVQGEPECITKTETKTLSVPEETCELQPVKNCEFVTKLVPKLIPKKNCIDVPKEICTRSKRNPRKVKRPVIKKWCYVPTEESGLADYQPPSDPDTDTTTVPTPEEPQTEQPAEA